MEDELRKLEGREVELNWSGEHSAGTLAGILYIGNGQRDQGWLVMDEGLNMIGFRANEVRGIMGGRTILLGV